MVLYAKDRFMHTRDAGKGLYALDINVYVCWGGLYTLDINVCNTRVSFVHTRDKC